MKNLFFTLILILTFAPFSFTQNVGIGTALPTNKLHVFNGSSGATAYSLSSIVTEADGANYINILAPNANETGILFGNPTAAVNGGIVYNNPGLPNGLQLRTNGNTTQMVIDQNGLVGIGTTAPLFDLDVNGTTQTSYLQPGFKSSQYEFLRFGNPGNYFAGFMNNITSTTYGDGDDFTLFTYGNRDILLRAGTGDIFLHNSATAGRVGIGTTTPNQKLQVMGNISWGAGGSVLGLSGTGGGTMELRGPAWTPFIDFSNDTSIDYDMRLILEGNNRLTVRGGDFAVVGTVSATRVKVTATGFPDYVFYDDYDLKTLEEVEAHIEKEGHLPGVPSEKEVVENGMDLKEITIIQQEKIEEIFLHLIEMKKELKELKAENSSLKKQLKQKQ